MIKNFKTASRFFCCISSLYVLGIVCAPSGVAYAEEEEDQSCCAFDRPDSIAPIGVYADHIHKKDSLMFGYRVMYNRSDTHQMRQQLPHSLQEESHMEDSDISDIVDIDTLHDIVEEGSDHMIDSEEEAHSTTTDSHSNTPAGPHTHRHRMAMHMFEAMYAPTDYMSIMAMTMVHQMEMLHREDLEESFTTENSGLGDTNLTALVRVYQQNRDRLHLGMGVSFPTGSLTNTDTYHGVSDTRHPYNMQLGSGTYDLLPSATFVSQFSNWSWGTQGMGTVRTGENDEGYSFGDQFNGSLWFAYVPNSYVSPSIRLNYETWQDVSGRDPRINFSNAFGDPDQQGGRELRLSGGINFLIGERIRVGFEVGAPIDSSVDEGSHETNWFANGGVTLTL